jgi:ATP-dependent DNA ligase
MSQALPQPMLARSAPVPVGRGLTYELKFDGFRAIARTGAEGFRVASRRGWDHDRAAARAR